MQGVTQQPPSGPSNDSLLAFAFLGQQLRQFSNSTPQHRLHNQPVHSSSHGFPLGANAQEQVYVHQNQHHLLQSVLNGSGGGGQALGGGRNGDRMGEMFQHLQHGNMGSNFDQQQFSGQVMNPNFSENIPGPSILEQNVQGIMEHLSMLQERIQQLQALVPLISQTAHCQNESNVVAQQQAARAAVVSIISQLAVVAIGLVPQSLGDSGHQVNQSTELPLSQLLQASVSPASNCFQQDTLGGQLRAPQRGNSLATSMGNSFDTSGGAVSGVGGAVSGVGGANAGVDVGGANGGGGLRYSNGGVSFSGLNNEGDMLGQQNLSSQHAVGKSTSGTMPHNQMGSGVGKDLGTVVGGGKGPGAVHGGSNMIVSTLAAGTNSFISHELGDMGAGLEDLDNDSRNGDEDSDGENIPPGSFDLVEMDASEILAEHTHFCEICGKGFKRDANLRMHMRGHGDEYKTPAALARPDRASHEITTATRVRRYSCPCVGCKRNKKHRKFQPLKTMLCVKNHYRRSHCPKLLTCQKCVAKKFSVVADLKTHEKHCGRDKWLCSCGTTFSRKDKLFGHIGLFAGHTPVMPLHDTEGGGSRGAIAAADHQGSPTSGSFGSDGKSSGRFWD